MNSLFFPRYYYTIDQPVSSKFIIVDEAYIKNIVDFDTITTKRIDSFMKSSELADSFSDDNYDHFIENRVDGVGLVRVAFYDESTDDESKVRFSLTVTGDSGNDPYPWLTSIRALLIETFGSDNIVFTDKTFLDSKVYRNGYSYSYSSSKTY